MHVLNMLILKRQLWKHITVWPSSELAGRINHKIFGNISLFGANLVVVGTLPIMEILHCGDDLVKTAIRIAKLKVKIKFSKSSLLIYQCICINPL